MASSKDSMLDSMSATLKGMVATERLFEYPPDTMLFDGVKCLPVEALSDYRGFLVGNDKPLTAEELAPVRLDSPFIFLGTSMMRSVDLACSLMASHSQIPPKIIIIDNSRQVVEAWAMVKKYFAETDASIDSNGFHEEFMDWLLEGDIYPKLRLEGELGTFTYSYMLSFLKRIPFPVIKSVIEGSVMLPQSWAEPSIATGIQSVYKGLPIVTYTSNIIHYIDAKEDRKVILSSL